MKESPILMSGPMVRALLAGTKTQTRRIVKPQPPVAWSVGVDALSARGMDPRVTPAADFVGPYGSVGDRLWVKETHCFYTEANEIVAAYRADDWTECPSTDGKWRPSIFCTRAASRITLEVTDIRVERLQAISKADACGEGIESAPGTYAGQRFFKNYGMGNFLGYLTPIDSYRTLWESINGHGSWAQNPWVWVIEFRRIEPAMEAA